MANENPQRPQPDFNIIAAAFLKVPNVPAIDGGQQLLAELREMRAQWTHDLAAIRRDITDVRQDLAATRQDLMTMITASSHNNAARVQNTYITTRNEPLSPFVNPLTATPILEFPTTSTQLRQLSEARTDTVLRQLGLPPVDGAALSVKKQTLRGHIGLKEVAGLPP